MTRLLFLLLLLGHLSFGQTTIRGATTISTDDINSDTINNSPNKTFNDKIKLIQIDKSQAKVDFRLYTLHSLSNTKTVRRLFLIDKTWSAVEYDEWNNPVKIVNYKLAPRKNFDSIFVKLLSNNILTLPNQSDLKNKMQKIEVTADGDTLMHKMMTTDGEGYTIEFKIGDKFRVYQFDNPDSYSKFYNNILELKDYLNIVQIFDKCLSEK